ncbi:hypothetical protein H5V45_08050 [Nocardioides sp. KIGAM211]|uniref:Lipoprotein n=1 Tax=Nocardioides luti TaxID=2761101 RepID=A0A7X0RFI5_9ACTN|nr:hypothetical protein [Nocardioides luti]MBB6627272.1 hypothetical protein [Nocardioides luti]
MSAVRRSRGTAAVAVLAATALLLAGCGSDDSGSGDGSKADAVALTVNPTAGSSELPVPERRFFNDSSPWNARVDGDRVDRRSARMISEARERVGVIERPDSRAPIIERRQIDAGLYINTEAWTTPVVAGGQPTSLICRQLVCGDGQDNMILNIPDDVDPDPRYDGWFTVFDTSSSVAYDLWRARREDDGAISYHYMRKWDLNGPGYSEPQVVSARGSGLPLFAGLIRPGELESGEIQHALAISVPGPAQNYFVAPASTTDGNGRSTSLPEGARIRLKVDIVMPKPVDPRTGKVIKLTAQQQRLADAIVACLRTYGAIVVGRAAVPTLYAQRDVTSGLLRGNELQGLRLDDFEVVQMGRLHRYPPDSEATAADAALATPAPSSTSTDDPATDPTDGATGGTS